MSMDVRIEAFIAFESLMAKPREMNGEIATFRRAAKQRVLSAEHLMRSDYNLDATYLAGYSVECILKALILQNTPVSKREEVYQKITKGSAMHNPEILGVFLAEAGTPIPPHLKESIRKMDWSPVRRYQTHRVSFGDAEAFLDTVKKVVEWAEGRLT
jgi:HEPN domain-containing protein